MKTVAIMHQAQTSGPSKTLRPSLERLATRGELEVVVPAPGHDGPGTVARQYADIARLTALPYGPLTVPGGASEAASTSVRLGRETLGLRRYLGRARPDIVVVATAVLPHALAAARFAGVPAIARVAEIFDKGHVGGAARNLGNNAVRIATIRLADAVVCSSEAVARQFAGAEVPVSTIHPGISAQHAAGDGPAFRSRTAIEEGAPLVVVVGNVTHGRGQDLAINAFASVRAAHPDARLAIVGAPHERTADVEYARSLEALATKLGLGDRVLFTGFVEEIADVYAAADVVLNPARFNEPFGRAALEGLIAGCPAVATRVGAIPEILTDGRDALLVDPEQPEAIASALLRLLDDRDLGARLAAAGRDLVNERYGVDRVADEFERVALEVIAARRR